MQLSEEFESDVLALHPELGCVFDDFDHAERAPLSEEVLGVPDLEFLLPSDELEDELMTSQVSGDGAGENSVAAMGSDEGEEELVVSVDDELVLTREEKEMELAARELKFLEAQRDFLQFKADADVGEAESENEQEPPVSDEVEEQKNRLEAARTQQQMLVDVINLHQQSLGDLHRLMIQASPLMHYVSFVQWLAYYNSRMRELTSGVFGVDVEDDAHDADGVVHSTG
ncbi:unnamed protein product [Phytophthora fragariaefolia]|uniref:Unnamed protein product n=1 Tax=Phytophthora fragariaefolia TaxID=1490495 RepID=A0A9W6XW40_9STRA|nr:unnamed protein product [Phytophthora fragariaefolia]